MKDKRQGFKYFFVPLYFSILFFIKIFGSVRNL